MRVQQKYQCEFGTTVPEGAKWQQRSQQQELVTSFLVDAGPEREGNPLAEMLDYGAFLPGYKEDVARSVAEGPNAMYSLCQTTPQAKCLWP